MKLEMGKTYVDSAGNKHEITSRVEGKFFARNTSSWLYWDENGKAQQGHGGRLHDLVSEAGPVIPHADILRALLDGKAVQYKSPNGPDLWVTMEGTAADAAYVLNYPSMQYRIKRDPITKYCALWDNGEVSRGFDSKVDMWSTLRTSGEASASAVLRLTIDPDTLDVIHATTEDA